MDEQLPFEEPLTDGSGELRSAQALYALTQLPRVGSGRAVRLAERFGSWDALLTASPSQLKAAVGTSLEVSRPEVRPDLPAGVQLVGWFDEDYPGALRALKDPPALLWVRGRLGQHRRLTVVGTRQPSRWGAQVADLLAAGAARRGVEVVSGLALGIDIAAHEAAVREGGTTVAVLGGGVDQPSPRRHAAQADRIVATGGALIAEVPPGTKPSSRTLVARNRIQAALSQATVMVQCGLGSGTMHTARFAESLGRHLVVAVPPESEADSPENAGNRAMLEHAPDVPHSGRPLRSLEDLDELFGLLG